MKEEDNRIFVSSRRTVSLNPVDSPSLSLSRVRARLCFRYDEWMTLFECII